MGRGKTSTESQDGLLVPTELPLLQLEGQVLLPTAFARISLLHKSVPSMALIAHLLQQRGSNVLVAVVPQSAAPSGHASQAQQSPQKGSASVQHHDRQTGQTPAEVADFGRLHALGTAARVLRLSRSAQSGNWVLELEGCCRVKVNGAHSTLDGHYTAAVEQLEHFRDAHARQEADELDAGGEAALAQLRQAARQLLGMVSLTSGPAAAARLADMLDAAPPGRCADLLAAVLMPPPAARLAVLDAVDVPQRLHLALSLVKDALKTAREAVGALGDSAGVSGSTPGDDRASLAAQIAALRRLQAAQKGLQGSSIFPGGAVRRRSGSGSGDGGEEGDELAELARGIDRAAMPPHVHKVAMRELTRLQRSSEQHPGYTVARTYLETLVDLPWNKFAAEPPAAAEPASRAGQSPDSHRPDEQAAQQQAQADSLDAGANSHAADQQPATSSTGLSLSEAQALLDEHHYGLDKVKRRIIQYLAVRRLRGPDAKAPILAFVGPPGVGKTSLARSVAEALGGRPFQRISLGGIRDEAEIRGHRRTYIGAMMGRVMQAVRQAGVRDGVLLLDEIDKVSRDARGDPAAALLEILDPEQNHAFVDNYLALGFDLSKVIFLATANSLASVPAPLLDRLEVVHLSGYTLDEKVHIAERHLIPKLLEEHGLSDKQLQFPRAAVLAIAHGHTREAGVRSLSRAIAAICRHVCVSVVEASDSNAAAAAGQIGSMVEVDMPELQAARPAAERTSTDSDGPHWETHAAAGASSAAGPTGQLQLHPCNGTFEEEGAIEGASFSDVPYQQVVVDEELIATVLGPARFSWDDPRQRVNGAGSAAGLVWTAAGGQVQYVECIATGRRRNGHPGSLTLTGQMGEVLGESARIALSWIRAHASQLPLLPAGDSSAEAAAVGTGSATTNPDSTTESAKADAADSTSRDVHLHLPAGAVPKDGPSAGITLAVALLSVFTGRAARADTALTGELTLRGLVLPVGGIKEKLLAAHQAGLVRVIIPEQNMPDVTADLPAPVRDVLEIIPVQRLDEVLAHAFDPPLLLQPRSRL